MPLAHLTPPSSRRRLVAPFKEVPLRPGDTVSLAEDDIVFEVQVALTPPPAAAAAASNGSAASAAAAAGAAGADLAPNPAEAAAADQQAAAALPAVVAALRLAAAQEALAAAQGLFPPGGAVYADVGDRARQLLAAGSFDQAYVLLLAGAMQQPWAGGEGAALCSLAWEGWTYALPALLLLRCTGIAGIATGSKRSKECRAAGFPPSHCTDAVLLSTVPSCSPVGAASKP